MKLEGWHIVIIIVLAIVLFGAPKLPGLARSVGQSLRIFKSEVKQMKDENNTGDAGSEPVEGRVVVDPQPTPPQRDVRVSETGTSEVRQVPIHGQDHGQGPGQAGSSQQSGSSRTTP